MSIALGRITWLSNLLGCSDDSRLIFHVTFASQIDDTGIAALSGMSAMTSLKLQGCVSVGEHGMALLPAQMPLLRCLKLGGCSRVATITDPCLTPLQHLAALTHLDLAGCLEITDTGLTVSQTLHLHNVHEMPKS